MSAYAFMVVTERFDINISVKKNIYMIIKKACEYRILNSEGDEKYKYDVYFNVSFATMLLSDYFFKVFFIDIPNL